MIVLLMNCPLPVMQNVTKFHWNSYDRTILVQAQKRCGELYPGSICVKLFRKFGVQDYSVICGAGTK